MVPNDTGVVAVFRNGTVKNNVKSAEAGRPIFDDVELCEVRHPGTRDYGVYPGDGTLALGCRSVHRRAARCHLRRAVLQAVPAIQGAAAADQVRHAARLPDVFDRGQACRASCAQHLHCGSSGDCRWR